MRRCGFLHDLRTHMAPGGPVEQLGLVAVVRTAAKLDVLHGGPPARRIGHDVMEFHESAPRTPSTLSADEDTATTVTDEDGPLDLRRNVPRGLLLTTPGTRPAGDGEFLLDQMLDEHVERAREDLRRIPIGDRVA